MTVSLLTQAQHGNIRALSQLITAIESHDKDSLNLHSAVYDARKGAPILGITGPPGAGKSSLTDRLIHRYRKQGERVGIVAIDPSSHFTGGAILGDRIRMMSHASDPGVFIRSLGTRGSHGGLSRATQDIVACLDAAGFDRIIVETVGVGQTELDIARIADTTLIVLVPEAGDVVQTMKAGLFEVADLFVINKSDRGGGENLSTALQGQMALDEKAWQVPVLLASALKDEGIEGILEQIEAHRAFARDNHDYHTMREMLRRELFFDLLSDEIASRMRQKIAHDKHLSQLLEHYVHEGRNPYGLLAKLLESIVP
ncbi:MAG: methylmalonyl Co-A mutase-associated GTPase MeaB [Deltaproteobacteria bacterium]|nr:methylmalonyl Co-A mutase-associated GTPase MeaB [Deltaproteobacteria bacterium]